MRTQMATRMHAHSHVHVRHACMQGARAQAMGTRRGQRCGGASHLVEAPSGASAASSSSGSGARSRLRTLPGRRGFLKATTSSAILLFLREPLLSSHSQKVCSSYATRRGYYHSERSTGSQNGTAFFHSFWVWVHGGFIRFPFGG